MPTNIPEFFDIFSLIFFVTMWVGYTLFSRLAVRRNMVSLSSTLNYFRRDWMSQILSRDMRIPDLNMVTIFERSCTFFASSSLLIIAGLLSLFSHADAIAQLIDYFLIETSEQKILIILLLLLIIFVYSFFVFTWSMRQFGFGGIMILSAPLPNTRKYNRQQKKEFADHAARILDLAATNFNYGLRSYYFALAALCWIGGSLSLVVATSAVVIVLYLREFKSPALKALVRAHKDIELPEDIEE